jgi:hypothetical protein
MSLENDKRFNVHNINKLFNIKDVKIIKGV